MIFCSFPQLPRVILMIRLLCTIKFDRVVVQQQCRLISLVPTNFQHFLSLPNALWDQFSSLCGIVVVPSCWRCSICTGEGRLQKPHNWFVKTELPMKPWEEFSSSQLTLAQLKQNDTVLFWDFYMRRNTVEM